MNLTNGLVSTWSYESTLDIWQMIFLLWVERTPNTRSTHKHERFNLKSPHDQSPVVDAVVSKQIYPCTSRVLSSNDLFNGTIIESSLPVAFDLKDLGGIAYAPQVLDLDLATITKRSWPRMLRHHFIEQSHMGTQRPAQLLSGANHLASIHKLDRTTGPADELPSLSGVHRRLQVSRVGGPRMAGVGED